MNITLRKASVLQNALADVIKNIKVEDEISINEFQNPEAEISAKAAALNADIARTVSLTSALYDIRRLVAQANAREGVDGNLTSVALIEKQIQFHTPLAKLTPRVDSTVVAGKLDKIRNRKSESRSIYGEPEEVKTSVFTVADIAVFKSKLNTLKKLKQKLQDEILEQNVRTTITLPDNVVQILQIEGLV
jgi:hypothetical protein